jgi:hypothetical protein
VLAGELGEAEPAPARLAVTPVVDALTAAVGLPAVADAVGAVVRGGADTVPELGSVPADAVELVRSSWLDSAADGLPRAWARDVTARVAGVEELRTALTAALAKVTLAARRSRSAAALLVVGGALGVLALTLAGLATGLALGGAPLSWPLVGATAGCLVGAVVARSLASGMRLAAGRRRAATVTADGRAAVEAVALARLVEPTREVLAEHRRARELVAAARTTSPQP